MENIGKIGKIIVSKKLKSQIDYLHNKIGATEWSGILVYKHTKGDISKMKDLVFKADDLFLMDIGTTGSTEFDYNTDIVDLYSTLEYAMEANTGLIHTHHSMGAFHSGTDMTELEANTENYNYYLSLVVDFKGNYKCKVGFPSKTKMTYENKVRNTKGEWVIAYKVIEKDVILLGDLDIEIQGAVKRNDWFSDRYDSIVAVKEKAKKATELAKKSTHVINHGNNFTNFNNEGFSNVQTHQTLAEKFLVAILNCDSNVEVGIWESMQKLELLTDIELEMYNSMLEGNIEILHQNVYGVNADHLFGYHITRAKEELQKRPLADNSRDLLITLNTAML